MKTTMFMVAPCHVLMVPRESKPRNRPGCSLNCIRLKTAALEQRALGIGGSCLGCR